MAMPYHELVRYSVRHDVVSPEQQVAQTFMYRNRAQFHGLGGVGQASSGDYRYGLGKSCCTSCANGGPCTGCGGPAGKACRCKGGGAAQGASFFPCMACGKARPTDRLPCPHCKQKAGWSQNGGVSLGLNGWIREDDYKKFVQMKAEGEEWSPPSASQFSPAFGGLGATTVIQGQADLEPGDYGYQFVSTTKPGTTVFGRRQGFVDPGRRMAVTRQIEELEFLTGTPGVPPRVLAQKVWAARRALMGIGDWEWASYADPRQSYDAKADLEARLRTVERLLGVDKLSPRMMMAYGSGALSGMGGRPEWGQSRADPVAQLASCIRGALCAPDQFCCPPSSCYDPGLEYYPEEEYYPDQEADWSEEFWDRPSGTGVPLPPPGGVPLPPPGGVPLRDPPPSIRVPGGSGVPLITTGGTGVPLSETGTKFTTGPVALRPIASGESIEDYTKYLAAQGLVQDQIQMAVGAAQEQLKRDAEYERQRQEQIKAREEAAAAAAAQAKAAAEARAAAQAAEAKRRAAAAAAATAPATRPRTAVTTGAAPGSWQWHHERTDYDAIKRAALERQARQRSGGYIPSGGGTAYLAGLGSLGSRPLLNMPGVQALRASARRAQADAARRRA